MTPRVPRLRIGWYGALRWNVRAYYSIKINQATPIVKPQQDGILLENKSILYYMNEYKRYFPHDQISNSLIDSYTRLTTFPQETIKIGVIYHDDVIRNKSKLVETILADPLTSNNKGWFNRIVERNKTENIKFEYESEDIEITGTRFRVPSPILDSVSRPRYMNPQTSITLNNIELYEINNLATFPKFNSCHFFVYVTNRLNTNIKLPESINDKILLTIVDNNDFTPSSSESSPIPIKSDGTSQIIKVNTEKSFEGIQDFLINDIKASNNYLDSLVDSNIFQFLKTVGYNLQIDKLIKWNLTKLINNISRAEITLEKLEDLYSELKSTKIQNFSSEMHYELNYEFKPKTEVFFNKRLRWWKLYFKNDNVEYDLKDYFQVNFMPKSIEEYNFLRGTIIHDLQNHNFGKYEVKRGDISNPLIKLKNQLINTRLATEIQPVVTSSLVYGMLYYQLPVSTIALCAYQFFDFSVNASASIFGLGMVMGFNYVSKNWEKFTGEWLKNLFEEVRVCIDRDCIENGLVKELSASYREETSLVNIKRKIIAGLSQNK